MTTPQLPLFDFFQSLREWEKQLKKQSLTLVEFEDLLKALDNCPFPLQSKEDYFRLCKLLWFKPFHEDSFFSNNEVGTFRKKFDAFWQTLEAYNKVVVVDQPIADKRAEPEKPKEITRTLTSEELKKRQEELDKGENKETKLSDNSSELTSFWADFSPSNTDGGHSLPKLPDIMDSEKKAVHLKQNFTFLEKHQFLPLDYRRLYQLIMSIRRIAFDGGRSGLNITASFDQLIRQGYLTEFAYQQRARRWLCLHLLIDIQGSMAAFEHIGDVIADILRDNSTDSTSPVAENKKSHVWYFHNCPNDVLYRNKDLYDTEKLDDWYKTLNKQAPAQIIIFSDAGAARGFRNNERINFTAGFLEKLSKHRVAWINPVSQSRWQGTAAAAIEQRVKMFDAHDASLVAAMQIIKGK